MSVSAPFSRRSFVKQFVFGTATAALFGQPWRRTFFAEAAEAAADGSGLLQLKLSDYPPLLDEFGSVRIGLNGILDDNTGPLGFFYPIVINRDTGGRFYALDAGCTHAGCVVPTYDAIDSAIFCPCHGSMYAIDGTVLGGPAVSPLAKLPITYDGDDTLSIRVPFLGYSLAAALVETSGQPRFQMRFQTRGGVAYEVRFRAGPQGAWTVVPFAMLPEEPATNTSLIGDDLVNSVYVDRPGAVGFFTVSIQVLDLTPT